MATYYKAKYYIDGREYSVVKDGLYTLNEIKKMCPHPTAPLPNPELFEKVNINPKDCYYFFGIRFCDKLEEYLK